jgi:hypothetical protein
MASHTAISRYLGWRHPLDDGLPAKKVKVHHLKIDMENVPKVCQIIEITKQVKERNLKEAGPIIQQIHLSSIEYYCHEEALNM